VISRIDYRIIDVALFVVANLADLLTAGIFLSRVVGQDRIETVLGLAFVSLALPATAAVVLNALAGREMVDHPPTRAPHRLLHRGAAT
jgi:hypothetical protein